MKTDPETRNETRDLARKVAADPDRDEVYRAFMGFVAELCDDADEFARLKKNAVDQGCSVCCETYLREAAASTKLAHLRAGLSGLDQLRRDSGWGPECDPGDESFHAPGDGHWVRWSDVQALIAGAA